MFICECHFRTWRVLPIAVLFGLLASTLVSERSAQADTSLTPVLAAARVGRVGHGSTALGSSANAANIAVESSQADLSVINSDNPDPVTQGSPLTYTVTIMNNGPDTAQTVLLTDTMPASATFNFATINQGSCGIAFPTLACQLGSINPGRSVTLTIRMTPNSPGTITNHAVATTATTDPNVADNSASQDTTVSPILADLSITNSDNPDPVTQGSPLTYTVTIVNHGPDTAQSVLLTDTMPTGASFNFATINQGSCGIAFPLLACQLGSINPGRSVTLTIRMTPNSPGTITNHAVATTATTDPNIANNSVSQDTTVIPLLADLSITNSDNPDPVTQGSPLTYTVTIVNHGPDTAQSVLLTDTMPTGASFNFATINQGSCGIAFPLLACQLGSISSGGSVVLTIRVTPNAPGTITNHAMATTATTDPNTANNSDSEDTAVVQLVTLSPAALPGGMVSVPYDQTISASNGTAPYAFAVTSGALPPGLALSAAGSLAGTPTTIGSFSFTVTAMDANGSTGSQSYTFGIAYLFTGFFQPVDALPALNVAKAGSAIPIKFSLAGNQSLNVIAAGYPASQQIACDISAPTDDIEQTESAGNSSLSYDPATDTYSYVWKTAKSWSGTCRKLIVRLMDGTDHVANFRFK